MCVCAHARMRVLARKHAHVMVDKCRTEDNLQESGFHFVEIKVRLSDTLTC